MANARREQQQRMEERKYRGLTRARNLYQTGALERAARNYAGQQATNIVNQGLSGSSNVNINAPPSGFKTSGFSGNGHPYGPKRK